MYSDLQRVAAVHVRRGGAAQSIDATSLIHEAYLRMAGRVDVVFAEPTQFLVYASRVMRSLLIDSARQRRAQKRGAQLGVMHEEITALTGHEVLSPQSPREALAELGELDAKLAELVALHVFGGFSWAEIAASWRVSERTVAREWRKARLLLEHALRPEPSLDAVTPC